MPQCFFIFRKIPKFIFILICLIFFDHVDNGHGMKGMKWLVIGIVLLLIFLYCCRKYRWKFLSYDYFYRRGVQFA